MASQNHSRWRLIVSLPAPGAWNMAVDEAILEFAGRGEVEPTLRLYSWEPACLSIGYAQPFADVDTKQLNLKRWQVVRRPTGGRAILHIDELTYSMIGAFSEPRLAGSVLESYQRLSTALLTALQTLGISAQALAKEKSSTASINPNPVCFEVPSDYEITYQGRKLIGSAQARRKEGVLQHGSLPLFGDLMRITQVLRYPDEDARNAAAIRLLDRAITVEGVLGHLVPWDIAARAVSEAFQSALDIEFFQQDLSKAEEARAQELVVEKYASSTWTNRV
jgi:lipoate-protein ligase A